MVFQDQSRIGWLVGWVERGDGRVGSSPPDPLHRAGEEFLSLRISPWPSGTSPSPALLFPKAFEGAGFQRADPVVE